MDKTPYPKESEAPEPQYMIEAKLLASKIATATGLDFDTVLNLLSSGWTITFSIDQPTVWEQPTNL